MKTVKKIFLGFAAALASIAAYLASLLELFRIALLAALDLPVVILLFAALFVTGCCAYGFLSMEGALAGKLISVVLFCLLIFGIATLAAAVLGYALGLIRKLLGWLNFSKAADFFRRLLEKIVSAYGLLLPKGPAPVWDRRLLFGIPFLIHGMLRICKKVYVGVRRVLYPLCGALALYIAHSQVYIGDCSDYERADHVISWILIVILGAFGTFVGATLIDAIDIGVEGASRLNQFFDAYSSLFRYWDENSSCAHEQPVLDDPDDEENPYYRILGEAKTERELSKLYHRLAAEVHPDVSPGTAREAAMLNEAYSYYRDRLKNEKEK